MRFSASEAYDNRHRLDILEPVVHRGQKHVCSYLRRKNVDSCTVLVWLRNCSLSSYYIFLLPSSKLRCDVLIYRRQCTARANSAYKGRGKLLHASLSCATDDPFNVTWRHRVWSRWWYSSTSRTRTCFRSSTARCSPRDSCSTCRRRTMRRQAWSPNSR